jgi:Na+/melibiose symporter-like transporter
LGLFLTGLSLIPFLWITSLEEAIIFSILRGFADSASYIVLLMILSDVYDEVTLATGKHQEATLQGIHNFFTRTAVILQAVIIATIHIVTGYNPNPHAVQTANALWGIRIHMALIPAICHLLAGIIILFLYDLKGEKQMILKNKLREKGL